MAATPDHRGRLDWLGAEVESGRYALPALLAAMTAAAIFLFAVTHGAGYYLDEWNVIYLRFDFTPGGLLAPYVGHLMAIPLLIEQLLMKTFGLGPAHLPIRLLWVGVILASSLLLFLYLRRRTLAWYAFLPACLLLVFGAAWQDMASTIGFLRISSIAAGLGALVALDRRSPRGDCVAAALLAVSLFSFSAAAPFVVGAAVTIWLRGDPDRRRRTWVWAGPLGVYLIWAVWAHFAYPGSPAKLSNLSKIPTAFMDGISTAIAAIGGRYLTDDAGHFTAIDHNAGVPIMLLLVALVIFLGVRRRLPRESLVGLAMLTGYYLTVALVISPAREPTGDHFVYEGALILAIALVPILPRRAPPLLACAAIGAAFVAFSLAPNIRSLSQAAGNIERISSDTRAGLTAIEIAKGSVPPSFEATSAVPEFHGYLFLPPAAGTYLARVDHYGSPAFSEGALLNRDDEARRVADAVLVSALGIHLQAGEPARAAVSACRGRPVAAGGLVTVAPGHRLTIRPEEAAGVEVKAARFANSPAISLDRAAGGEESVLTIPRDRATRPWRLEVSGPAEVGVCGGRSGSV